MLLETPRAIYEYRKHYKAHKHIQKVTREEGLIEGFFCFDSHHGASFEDWYALIEELSKDGMVEAPQSLIDFATEKGWLTKIEHLPEPDDSWKEWENAA